MWIVGEFQVLWTFVLPMSSNIILKMSLIRSHSYRSKKIRGDEINRSPFVSANRWVDFPQRSFKTYACLVNALPNVVVFSGHSGSFPRGILTEWLRSGYTKINVQAEQFRLSIYHDVAYCLMYGAFGDIHMKYTLQKSQVMMWWWIFSYRKAVGEYWTSFIVHHPPWCLSFFITYKVSLMLWKWDKRHVMLMKGRRWERWFTYIETCTVHRLLRNIFS